MKPKTVSKSFLGMFEVFCNFGILTAFMKSKGISDRTKYFGMIADVRGEKG